MIRVDIECHIDRPPAEVFERLKDIGHYRTWLPRSAIYLDSRSADDTDSIGIGTTFADGTTMGTLAGRVTDFEPPRRIAFTQTLKRNGSVIFESRPENRLEPRGGGTIVHHSGEAELARSLKPIEPLVWLFARYERRRVVRALKASLERR